MAHRSRRKRTPVVSVSSIELPPHDLANLLEIEAGIEVRAGLHCAARIHSSLGTAASGGTLRFSPGHRTTSEEIEQVIALLHQLC